MTKATRDGTSARLNPRDAVYATVSLAAQFGQSLEFDQLRRMIIGGQLSLLEASMAVDELVAAGQLASRERTVCLISDEALLDDAVEAARRADQLWPHAKTWARRIGKVPFVRMVAVTGPLARGAVADTDAIELFIAVRPRRLWMSRRLIAQVIASASKQGIKLKIAYITSTRTTELIMQSPSVGWELAHMAVIVGKDFFRTIRRSNDWVDDLFAAPSPSGNLDHFIDLTPSSQQRWTEALLLLPPFRRMENWTRNRQIERLQQTEVAVDPPGLKRGTRTEQFSTDVCDERLGSRCVAIDNAWIESLMLVADNPETPLFEQGLPAVTAWDNHASEM